MFLRLHHKDSRHADRREKWIRQVRKTLFTLEGHAGGVSAVAVTADGRHAVSASDNSILHSHASQDRVLEDNALRLWDLESGQRLRTLKGHTEPITDVAIMAETNSTAPARISPVVPQPLFRLKNIALIK